MRVNIDPGTLRIASSNAEQEEAKEELEVDYGGDAIEIGFNVTYLMDVLANIPQDDDAVYEMVSHADTIGVFQIESRAQQSMLPRLRPNCFYDLVIEVAIVRPGPIQGDMVHPYLRRRNGEEPVEYPSKEVESILARTLGVPLFQEQAMKLSMVAAGFSPGDADALRRALSHKRAHEKLPLFRDRYIEGCLSRGYERHFAEKSFDSFKGFSHYGFPESHSASFALIAYFMKRHGRYGWPLTVAVSIAVPIAFFLLFERWFLVLLPKGPLEAALGF